MLPAAPVLGAHVRKSLELAAARPAFSLGLRAATTTIGPLVLGEVTHQPLFTWMALGGWLCAIADPGGPHLLRARTMAAFAGAATLVTGLGTVASTRPALSIARLTGAGRAGGPAHRHGAGRLRGIHRARARPLAGARLPARPPRHRELLPR